MSRLQISGALLVPLLWGCQFVVIKIGLQAFSPLLFVAVRFAVIAVILVPLTARPRRGQLGPIVAISVFLGGLNFGLTFCALVDGTAGASSIVSQLSTPFTVLLAWPLVGDRPSRRVIAGVAVAFAGVALLVLEPGASAGLLPTVLMLGAAFALAVGNVLTKRWGPFPPMTLIGWVSLFTAPQALVASLLLEHGQLAAIRAATPSAWWALSYTVVFGGIAGFGLWFWLIAHHSVTRVAPFALLQSVFAVGAGLLFLREPLTWPLVVGMTVCIGGVAITQRRGPPRPLRESSTPQVVTTPERRLR